MNVRLEVLDNDVYQVVFDRPNSSANIFDRQTLAELETHLDSLSADTRMRGLIFLSAKDSIFIAGADNTAGQGAILLAVYSLGLGVPFLLAAAFAGPFMNWAKSFRRHMAVVEKVMGLMLVATGILFITGGMSYMAFWLLETFPSFAEIG